jgi:hypothetical protein
VEGIDMATRLRKRVVDREGAGWNWTNRLFWLFWAVGSALWGAIVGVFLSGHGEEAIQTVVLGFPLVTLATVSALIWAFKVFLD